MSASGNSETRVPKVRTSCFECQKRRIQCDRTRPCCRKCQKKGIECSGFGVRHRFAGGVASRGKWAGKSMQAIFHEQETHDTEATPDTLSWTQSANIQDGPILQSPSFTQAMACPSELPFIVPSNVNRNETSCTESVDFSQWTPDNDNIAGFTIEQDVIEPYTPALTSNLMLIPLPQLAYETYDARDGEALEEVENTTAASVIQTNFPLLPLSPDGLDSANEFMLLYFSQRIAREMMIIDGPHNGWRCLILPMARTDSLIRDAVLAVSSFHLSLASLNSYSSSSSPDESQWLVPGLRLNPRHQYVRAINGLNSRQLSSCDRASQHSVLVTILVLLTSSMVTGDQDFPILYRMLRSAFDVLGGEEGLGKSDLADFLVRQIHKLSVYAAPLISEETGLQTMSSPIHMMQLFECINHCAQQQPRHQQAVTTVISLIHQARDIYLNQTPHLEDTSEDLSTSTRSVARIQTFIDTLENFPREHPGEQVLVWATFVAASDCTTDTHKSYFESYLRWHHARSGFMNLLKGIDCLRRIWNRRSPEKWARLLPEEKLFIM